MSDLRLIVNEAVPQREYSLIEHVISEFIGLGYDHSFVLKGSLNEGRIGYENKIGCLFGLIPLYIFNLTTVDITNVAKINVDGSSSCCILDVYGRNHVEKLKKEIEKIALTLGIRDVILNLIKEEPWRECRGYPGP